MCIIIDRDPDVIIPKTDFLTAVENNPHGWGLCLPDEDKKLFVVKNLTMPDPEEFYETLHTDYGKEKFSLHLRYTTAGETILRNAHPFPILEREADGVDLRMCHNGTIFKYKPKQTDPNKWESDTRVFVREYVRPLFKRLIRGNDISALLRDPFLEKLLEEPLTSQSVLHFISGTGETMKINALGNGGEQREGYYVSNTYSFKPDHRKKKTSSGTYGGQYSTTRTNGTSTGASTKSHGATLADPTFAVDTQVKKFTVSYGVSLTELACFDDEAIAQLCHEFPEDAENLLKELIFVVNEQINEIAEFKKEQKV